MTELFRYIAPTWLSHDPDADRLLNSLTRDQYITTHQTAAERPYSESPDRPPLYPFSPL